MHQDGVKKVNCLEYQSAVASLEIVAKINLLIQLEERLETA